MYELRDDFPVPRRRQVTGGVPRGRPYGSKYPFKEMEIGTGFVVGHLHKFSLNRYRKYEKPGMHFITHKTREGLVVLCVADPAVNNIKI
jgi:hypothetical protein